MSRCFKLYTYHLNNKNLERNNVIFEESYSAELFNLSFTDVSKMREDTYNSCKYYNTANYENKSNLADFINLISQAELKIDLTLDNIDDYINIKIIKNYFNTVAAKVKNLSITFEAVIDFEYNMCYYNNKHSKFFNSVKVQKNISLIKNKYYRIDYILSTAYKENSNKEEKNISNYLCLYTCEVEPDKKFLLSITKNIINDNKINYRKFNKLDAVKLIVSPNIDERKAEKNNILNYINTSNIRLYIEKLFKETAKDEFFVEFFLDTVKDKLHLVTFEN